MEQPSSPVQKKQKNPQIYVGAKTCVTCTNIPDSLFDAASAKRHFSKFGRVTKIVMRPKRQMCIIEYETAAAAERALLNAGAYDGFMFDVTRKQRTRKRSKKEDDPDWLPDSDVEEELHAMSGAPLTRIQRQKPIEVDVPQNIKRSVTKLPVRKKETATKPPISVPTVSGIESPTPPAVTALTTAEAATELHQLRFRVAFTPDEQWRVLDARDKILRAWGGTGARVEVGGATIGTCPDMCPEKERLHRQAEHQVMSLESAAESDGWMDSRRAVKQYSRSSADQEMPMCYELRPARVLLMTCSYMLHEIADTDRQVSLADWFHFMWDRFRGIRKDITQQALCCADSIRLMEMCARFHAHCAARLADLEHSQFDQKLNTDNLTKCLQTLKHMYADATPDQKPLEAEFWGYIALLNLGDSNFWWEIKRLPREIQKSESITFAIQVFNALDNNNYVRFFRLVREKATYLQACILLRYFNDVRARGLARIVKAYAPRGGSRYPARDLIDALAFEGVESLQSFVSHYGLRYSKSDDIDLSVILDRNQFIEDSDPYPISRAITLIESKRRCSVGEVISGCCLPEKFYLNHTPFTSFNPSGILKGSALLAEDYGYHTTNDSNKDITTLKMEMDRLSQGGKSNVIVIKKVNDMKIVLPKPAQIAKTTFKVENQNDANHSKQFTFKHPIQIHPKEGAGNIFGHNNKTTFFFSAPQKVVKSKIFGKVSKLFESKKTIDGGNANVFSKATSNSSALLGQLVDKKCIAKNKDVNSNIFKQFSNGPTGLEKHGGNKNNKKVDEKGLFNQTTTGMSNVFANAATTGIFYNKGESNTIFGQNANTKKGENIFALATSAEKTNESIFAKANHKLNADTQGDTGAKNIFSNSQSNVPSTMSNSDNAKSIFGNALKTVNGTDLKYSIFQSKNKLQQNSDAGNMFNSMKPLNDDVYDFESKLDNASQMHADELQNLEEQRLAEIRHFEEQKKIKELEREQLLKQQLLEEEKLLLETKRKQEELKKREEKMKQEEERRREEQRKRLEEEKRLAEQKRKMEEEKRFHDRVNKESLELVEELIDEVNRETVTESIKSEDADMKQLVKYGKVVRDELIEEMCREICHLEMKAEVFLTQKLVKKWSSTWRKHCLRNKRRRHLLDGTPVWLSDLPPEQEAQLLKRKSEPSVLQNMKAIQQGYKFTGEPKTHPTPEPYKVADIIRSSLLKRLRQISYPCDKCFFWKVTLVSPGANVWINRKIELKPWLLSLFSDNEKHESESSIQVQKYSWNKLIDFAISVSLVSEKEHSNFSDALDGTNGLLFYSNESDGDLISRIEKFLEHRYPYQILPLAVITSHGEQSTRIDIDRQLSALVDQKLISSYKLYLVDNQNTFDSLNSLTKSALKWLARNYPAVPNLEIDLVKSMCQRYLGNEIWYRLKLERQRRLVAVFKDLNKLIKIYNLAVDKLTEAITDEDLFNYPSFPLEFKKYLNGSSPYPKPYEFISSSTKTAENTSTIRDLMRQLKLPNPMTGFRAFDVESMQDQIRGYCNAIGWFENPEEVVCKVVAVISNDISDSDLACDPFSQSYENYDILDILNVIVYEKINSLNNFNNRLAIYQKSVLENYRTSHWWYETELLRNVKHKAIEYEDEIDYAIEAKRIKLSNSHECLKLEERDVTLVEDNVNEVDVRISKLHDCDKVMKELELKVEEQRQKSADLENLLRTALGNV